MCDAVRQQRVIPKCSPRCLAIEDEDEDDDEDERDCEESF
jgi:hypothetical protein